MKLFQWGSAFSLSQRFFNYHGFTKETRANELGKTLRFHLSFSNRLMCLSLQCLSFVTVSPIHPLRRGFPSFHYGQSIKYAAVREKES